MDAITKNSHPDWDDCFFGAASQIRTGHPVQAGFAALEPHDLTIESALRAWDEVASSNGCNTKETAIPIGMAVSLELLARFELATSSLPRMRSTC